MNTLIAPPGPLPTMPERVLVAVAQYLTHTSEVLTMYRVPGINPWKDADGNRAAMFRMALIGGSLLPARLPAHVIKPMGFPVLLLVVRIGHEEADTAALVATLEAQQAPTVCTNIEGSVFWAEEDNAPAAVQIVAIAPKPQKEPLNP